MKADKKKGKNSNYTTTTTVRSRIGRTYNGLAERKEGRRKKLLNRNTKRIKERKMKKMMKEMNNVHR